MALRTIQNMLSNASQTAVPDMLSNASQTAVPEDKYKNPKDYLESLGKTREEREAAGNIPFFTNVPGRKDEGFFYNEAPFTQETEAEMNRPGTGFDFTEKSSIAPDVMARRPYNIPKKPTDEQLQTFQKRQGALDDVDKFKSFAQKQAKDIAGFDIFTQTIDDAILDKFPEIEMNAFKKVVNENADKLGFRAPVNNMYKIYKRGGYSPGTMKIIKDALDIEMDKQKTVLSQQFEKKKVLAEKMYKDNMDMFIKERDKRKKREYYSRKNEISAKKESSKNKEEREGRAIQEAMIDAGNQLGIPIGYNEEAGNYGMANPDEQKILKDFMESKGIKIGFGRGDKDGNKPITGIMYKGKTQESQPAPQIDEATKMNVQNILNGMTAKNIQPDFLLWLRSKLGDAGVAEFQRQYAQYYASNQ